MTARQIEEKLKNRPHSPLVARLAHEYLAVGRAREAHELCVAGLDDYPAYPTLHLILAKCYVAQHDFLTALVHLQEASRLSPDSSTLRRLKLEWETGAIERLETPTQEQGQESSEGGSGKVEKEPSAPSDRQASSSDGLSELPVSPVETETVQPQILETTQSSRPDVSGVPFPEFPAVERASPVAEPSSTPEQSIQAERPAGETIKLFKNYLDLKDDGRIVSKTLAEIYATQGAYEEAIITYRLLKRKTPDHTEQLDDRIRELEAKLRAKLMDPRSGLIR